MDIASFEKFLVEHIKVDNKVNQLSAGNVTVVREKSKVTVNSEVPMSKRYLKYLTKKCVPGALRARAGCAGGGEREADRLRRAAAAATHALHTHACFASPARWACTRCHCLCRALCAHSLATGT